MSTENNNETNKISRLEFFRDLGLVVIVIFAILFIPLAYLSHVFFETEVKDSKELIYTEGKKAYLLYLENNKSFQNIKLKDIAKDTENKNKSLIWDYNSEKNAIYLDKKSFVDEDNNTYDTFYEAICSHIQTTKNDDFKTKYSTNNKIKKVNIQDIKEQLACIYEGNEFKIIYSFNKI